MWPWRLPWLFILRLLGETTNEDYWLLLLLLSLCFFKTLSMLATPNLSLPSLSSFPKRSPGCFFFPKSMHYWSCWRIWLCYHNCITLLWSFHFLTKHYPSTIYLTSEISRNSLPSSGWGVSCTATACPRGLGTHNGFYQGETGPPQPDSTCVFCRFRQFLPRSVIAQTHWPQRRDNKNLTIIHVYHSSLEEVKSQWA